MNFKEEQKEKVEKIEAILREYLPEANGYQSVIMEAMEYSLMAGGKRLRPMLMMETWIMMSTVEEERRHISFMERIWESLRVMHF